MSTTHLQSRSGVPPLSSLGDFISPSKQKADPASRPEAPYVGLEHIERDKGMLIGHGKANEVRSTKSVFRKGDLLYGKLRPYLNKVWVAQFDGVCSTDILVYPKNDQFDSDYLKYRFMCRDFIEYANAHSNGVNLPRVNHKVLAKFPLTRPPLEDQRRIVAEIETQFTRLDAGVAALKRAQANLKRYRAAVLKAACEGKLVPTEAQLAREEGRDYEHASVLLQRILEERRKNWTGRGKYKEPIPPDTSNLPELPEGWVWATISQLAATEPNAITDGPFGSNLKTSHYTNFGPRVIRLQNIGNGCFIDNRAHISEEHFAKLVKHQVRANDVVIAALGEDIPRSCLIPAAVGPAIVKADCIRFKSHVLLRVKFLVAALNSEGVRARAKDIIHGVGRPRLNLSEVKSIVLPIPPLQEQTRIMLEVDRTVSILDASFLLIGYDNNAQNLRSSILQKAMGAKDQTS